MTRRAPRDAPKERMSDAQYAATLSELRRLTLIGSVPPCFEAEHVLGRPELELATRADRIRFQVQMKQALNGTVTTPRTVPDARRNMRTSRS